MVDDGLRHRVLPVILVLALFGAGLLVGGPAQETRRMPALEARLAFVDDENNLITSRADGSDRRRVVALEASKLAAPPLAANNRLYRWPTWAPDGTRLAFMTIDLGSDGRTSVGAVHIANLDGSTARQIWAGRQGGPIYFAWQPQGRLLALLVLGEDTLHLLASDPLTNRPWYPLAKGQPIYVSWSPDGRSAALHVGGDQQSNPEAQIALATWAAAQAGPRFERLALTPSGFRAPAWSADGRWLALGIHQPDGPAVVLRARDGATYPLTSSGAEPAFVWSPVGPLIAVSDAAAGLPNVYEGIRVHDVARGKSWPVTDERVVGFFWSPDGTRLAYMALDIASQAIAWHVVHADGRGDRLLARFLPTREQFQTFAFFDQYAQSNAVWSPDGQALVAAGWDVADGRPLPSAAPGIYVIPADGRTPPRRIGPGSQAFWSPLATPAWQP